MVPGSFREASPVDGTDSLMEPTRPRQPLAPRFSQPVRQILSMVIVLVLVAIGAWMIHGEIETVFRSNLWLNGTILLVFVIGMIACFWQVAQLIASVSWIEGFAQNRPGYVARRAPRLLVPLAQLLSQRPPGQARVALSSGASRSILDSVSERIEEGRDITRYLANLLIFLGLLGTFFGLATTVPAVVGTIAALNPAPGEDSMAVFARLMSGLNEQLGGMGTAFSSSLLGLAGSLVIGMLELFAGHGQNRFYRELEEWLSSMTHVGLADEGGREVAAGLAGQLAEQVELLLRAQEQAEARSAALYARLGELAEALGRLAGRTEGEAALARVAEGQERLVAVLAEAGPGGLDAESRMRLRSIDVQLLKILEEIAAGRQEALHDLRGEFAALGAALTGVRRA